MVNMNKTGLAFGVLFLLLVGVVSADGISCIGGDAPNLRTTLYLNCTTEAAPSMCWAMVVDNASYIVGYYPAEVFTIDREGWYTSDDGKFIASINIADTQFAPGRVYTAEIHCVANDSSSNMTAYDFQPATYATPDWFGSMLVWVKDNIGVIFAAVIVIIVIVLFVAWLLRRLTS